MAQPRIVLHVGAQKAGSTWLQRHLRSEPELWRAHGVYVPVLPEVERLAGNAKLLAACLGAEARAFRRGFPGIDPGALDPAELVSRLLTGWRPERELLLLSAENLGAAQARPLRELLPRDVDYTVVLFVRNQGRWIDSCYRQQVKMMLYDSALPEFVRLVLGGGTMHYPDWHGIYEAWQTAFGECRVVVLEEAAPDLLGAFAAAAELPLPPALPRLEPQNVSPDAFQIAYLLALPRTLEFSEFKQRRCAASEAARRSRNPPLRFLSVEDQRRLRRHFEPGNRRLLELLGRPYEGSPLDLSLNGDGRVTPLEDVYRARAYASYARLADSIYAQEVGSPGDGGTLDPVHRLGGRLRRGGSALRRGEPATRLPHPPRDRP